MSARYREIFISPQTCIQSTDLALLSKICNCFCFLCVKKAHHKHIDSDFDLTAGADKDLNKSVGMN